MKYRINKIDLIVMANWEHPEFATFAKFVHGFNKGEKFFTIDAEAVPEEQTDGGQPITPLLGKITRAEGHDISYRSPATLPEVVSKLNEVIEEVNSRKE